MATLSAAIASDHGVEASEVAHYRGRRDPVWDAGLFLLAAVTFAAGVRVLTDRIRSRFNSAPAVTFAIVCAAVPVAILGVAAGELLSLIGEGIRVSNLSHLGGFRGQRIPWRHHRVELLAAGIALFWLVAAATAWRHRAQTHLTSHRGLGGT